MDGNQVLTAVIAGMVVLHIVRVGSRFHKSEITGGTIKGFDLWLFGWIAVGGAIVWLGQSKPFFWSLMTDITGFMFAVAITYWAGALWRYLRPRPDQ